MVVNQFGQFGALLKREIIENRNLFISTPALLAVIFFVFTVWVVSFVPSAEIATGIEYLSVLFDGLSPLQMAPVFLLPAVPFIVTLYICGIIYLINSLYQDRKDASVLFWQSMPVSNLQTVLSKVVTICATAPAFYVAILFVLYLLAVAMLTALGLTYNVQVAGLSYMFMASVLSLLLIYLSAITTALWLLPSIGWLLLFSAFARKTPILWAVGVFILLGFLEDFVFGSQYLANWVESRSNPQQYMFFEFTDVVERLISYDMLFGVVVGSILIAGAISMRRFID
ncbi:MAG: hypothetical protein CMQ14_12580 [Gammaproteobacteria bacterium]|nr:hypothetical protein [Gammaproteobacteria bacterium]|tara:strand:+ start:929 stop:1780 length:852 start_codon:yes stop_codon:yes gene_type:complete